MITIKKDVGEIITNTNASSNFTIKPNGKAFKVLIDGLYTDKIQSVTREIWSNALDSHIMAGNPDEPFEVSFPSRFDPTFRVRDFGVGLRHDDVVGLYSTMFESTKEDTNDQTGKFGIGSKSPFAYTDSFSVVSVFNGHKNYYTALLNVDGIPAIHHLHHEIVDERNGVEVSFPVRNEDIYIFQEAAKRVSIGFKVKPIVKEDTKFVWPTSYSSVLGSGVYAHMGSVVYPVDIDILKQELGKEQYSHYKVTEEFLKSMEGSLTVFEIEMGGLEISPTRESLSYGRNDPTTETILSAIEKRYESVHKDVQALIDSYPSAYMAYNNLYIIKNRTDGYGLVEDSFYLKAMSYYESKDVEKLKDLIYWVKTLYGRFFYHVGRNQSSIGFTGSIPVWRGKYALYDNVCMRFGKYSDLRFSDIRTHATYKKAIQTNIKTHHILQTPNSYEVFDKKTIFYIVDRTNDEKAKKSQVYAKNKRIRETINIINSNIDKETLEKHYYEYVEYYGPESLINFIDCLNLAYVEGVDYELVDLENVELTKEQIEKSKKAFGDTSVPSQPIPVAIIYFKNKYNNVEMLNSTHYYFSENSFSVPYGSNNNTCGFDYENEPDVPYIIVENSMYNQHPYMYNTKNFQKLCEMLVIEYDMPIIVMAPNNFKKFGKKFTNYTHIEDLDLTFILERAIKDNVDYRCLSVYMHKDVEDVSSFCFLDKTVNKNFTIGDLVYFSDSNIVSKHNRIFHDIITTKKEISKEYSKYINELEDFKNSIELFEYIKKFEKYKSFDKQTAVTEHPLKPRMDNLLDQLSNIENEIFSKYSMLKYIFSRKGVRMLKESDFDNIVIYLKQHSEVI